MERLVHRIKVKAKGISVWLLKKSCSQPDLNNYGMFEEALNFTGSFHYRITTSL
jgi:hypothetical protein